MSAALPPERRTHLVSASAFGFSVFRFWGIAPAAHIEGYSHAGVTEFVGEGRVDESAGYDHAADAKGGDALGGGATGAAVLGEAAFENAHHGAEDVLEGTSGGLAAAGYIRGRGNRGAGILDVFKMLAREIGADDLRADVAGGEVHFHAFPTAFPIGVGEEAGEDLGVEIAFALEIAVEAAVSEAGAGHDLLDRDTLEAVAIEELASAVDDGFFDGRAVSGGVWHEDSLVRWC